MKSYSKNGEDAWIYNFITLPMKGVFVDVGAGHPTINSNTYLFETLGWTGLCIDGNDVNKQYFEKSRKNSIFVNSVVYRTTEKVYFDKNHNYELSGIKQNKTTNTETTTLNKILKEHNIEVIDLLSINIQGHEFEALQGLELAVHDPKIIIVKYGLHEFRALEYLIRKGYKIKTLTESNFILTR